MLSLAGYLNLVIAFAHIVGLVWADKMFKVTGISTEMNELSSIHTSLPYLLTIGVSGFFLVFGLYGLSAANKFKKLPFQKIAIFLIAGIYLFRGLGELSVNIEKNTTTPNAETSFSLAAVVIGLLFLIGGQKKWGIGTRR